jgi:hypothetical protein
MLIEKSADVCHLTIEEFSLFLVVARMGRQDSAQHIRFEDRGINASLG